MNQTNAKKKAAANRDQVADVAAQIAALERSGLPRAIATLSAEGQQLVTKATSLSGTAARLLDDRLKEVGQELARLRDRLAVVE